MPLCIWGLQGRNCETEGGAVKWQDANREFAERGTLSRGGGEWSRTLYDHLTISVYRESLLTVYFLL